MAMSKTCFVIGPIGEPGSAIRAAADDFIKYIVSACPALKEFDYSEPVRADQLEEPGRITSQIIKLLIDADLVIADLTGNNPNVYYELSLRHAIGKRVIHMAMDGTPLSFDIRDNRTIFYTMHSRVVDNVKEELANQIRRVHQEGYKPMNPILETVAIINLERATDPVERTMGTLIQMVESLGGDVKSIASALDKVRVEQDFQKLLIAHSAPGLATSTGSMGGPSSLFPPYNAVAGPPGGILGGLGRPPPSLLDIAASSHTPPENAWKPPSKPPQKK